ncbi:unnamed protein product, partial [Ectocarpus sp. 13 AM-2016]
MSGPDALQLLLRAVCSGLSTVTPALVLQQLQNFAVPAGTTFKAYLEDLKVLVESVQMVGFAEDGTLQVAVKAGVADQYATLTAPVFHGRNTQALPYDSLESLMEALDDMTDNTTTATASVRVRGVGSVVPRGQVGMSVSSRGRYGGGGSFSGAKSGFLTPQGSASARALMTVAQYDDESREFWQVSQVSRGNKGFGRNDDDPPFYLQFTNNQERDR